jgi:DNA polymerase delta subunit 2
MTVPPKFENLPFAPSFRPEISINVSSEYRQTPENQVFERQFAGNYFVRYHNLAAATALTAQQRWPQVPVIASLKSAKTTQGKVAVVGAVYKEGRLKPNVLDELQKFSRIIDQHFVPQNENSACLSATDSDTVYLEDPESRVQLEISEKFRSSAVCTGLVIAAVGEFDARGTFKVESWTLPGAIANRSISSFGARETRKTVLFVSGLNLGKDEGKASMLLDWVMGLTGDPRAAEIFAVVVAGNSICSDFLPLADAFFTSLASVLPVLVLPGDTDPVNFALPQQPLHSAIFGHAKTYKNVMPTTNPARFDLDQVKVLGTAGQGVREISWYTENSVLESLRLSLNARLLAPTAPDTLACYPVTGETDIMVINQAVDIFFAGNCKEVAIGQEGDTLLLGLSSFAETGEALLVNLSSKTADILEFRN